MYTNTQINLLHPHIKTHAHINRVRTRHRHLNTESFQSYFRTNRWPQHRPHSSWHPHKNHTETRTPLSALAPPTEITELSSYSMVQHVVASQITRQKHALHCIHWCSQRQHRHLTKQHQTINIHKIPINTKRTLASLSSLIYTFWANTSFGRSLLANPGY